LNSLVVFAVEIFDEVLDQRRQIVEPIAERRQLDREDRSDGNTGPRVIAPRQHSHWGD
jgi:hypothetical protein